MIHFPLAPSFSVACLLCGTQEAEGAWLVLTEMVETSSPGRFAVPCRAPEFRHFCPSCAQRFPDPLGEWKRRAETLR